MANQASIKNTQSDIMEIFGKYYFFCSVASHPQTLMNAMKVYITVILKLIVGTLKEVLHALAKVGILAVEHLEIVKVRLIFYQ